MRVLGIDPGGRQTGVVVVEGDQPVDGTVAVFIRGDVEPCVAYARRVGDWLFERYEISLSGPDCGIDLVAIEGVVAPTPHMGLSNPAGIVDTGVVFGALWADLTFHDPPSFPAVEVAPGGHGEQRARLYPAALRGRAPLAGDPGGDRRHVRSAYDVALAGRTQHRIGSAA